MTVPPHVLAMAREVAGLVLDDWARKRWGGLHDEFRALTLEPMMAAMERAARSDAAAFAPLATLSPEALRRHLRAWAEPALLHALNDAAMGLVVIA